MAIFMQFLPYLFTAAQSIPKIMEFIEKTKANLKSKGEWTPEADAAFTAELENWKPEI